MSAGGIFKLIANDGKADKMIMATELLNHRIREIACMRQKQGYPDPSPTLVDLERTHILFVNSHFKPFAAIGYEYNKTRPQTGTAGYAQNVQFNIPQFGDFFYDMVVNVTLAATSATAGTVPAFPAYIGAFDQNPSATSSVSATRDTVNGIYTRYTQEYVNLAGEVQTVGAAATNFVRYCEFPGQRLFKKVKFEVNGNPLDEYSAEAAIFYQKYHVLPGKQTGWARLVGQEVPKEAYSDLLSIASASAYPSAVTGVTDVNGSAVTAAPVNASNTARHLTQVVDGPQTPKATQPQLDLWVPLLFWFNRDVRLSIPSVCIPYGQRYINIELESQANILFTAPGNLFLRTTIEKITHDSAAAGKGTAAGVVVMDYKKYVSQVPVLATGSTIDSTQQITNMELYINNIFVNPEIHDIYIRRIGFSLIRVHRMHKQTINVASQEVLLGQLKWPIEYIFVGVRPAINVDASNTNQFRDWHRLTLLTDNYIDINAKAGGKIVIDDTANINDAAKSKSTFSQQSVERLTYAVATETVTDLQLKAHGISIYNQYKSAFFRDYMAFNYGGLNMITPEDQGALLINFCLFPGTYQPSGHINVSRAREFYLGYTSSYVSSTNNCELIAIAKAINFLLISDGSAVLRYST